MKKIYVYAKGNEYTGSTGGWSNQNNKFGINDEVTNNGTVVKHSGFIEIKINDTYNRCCAAVGTAKKIDLYNYKQIIYTFIDPTNSNIITKTLDIETINPKSQYIVCGIDRKSDVGNGLWYGTTPTIGNVENSDGHKSNVDNKYNTRDKMYLQSIELVPNK